MKNVIFGNSQREVAANPTLQARVRRHQGKFG
jgi:hypothetical protein